MVIPDPGGLQRLPGPICLEVPNSSWTDGDSEEEGGGEIGGGIRERFLLDMEEGGAEQEVRGEGVVAGHHY